MSVWSLISGKLQNTVILATITFLLAAPISILLGAIAALRASKPADHAITITSLALVSMPEFVLGSVLIAVFFSWLGLLPRSHCFRRV